ncbi:MAG: chromate transporter [Gemmatimonas sp.]
MTGVSLVTLALIFAELSLLAFGGANAVLPEMQRQVVEVQGWMSAGEFSSLFALAQAAPGPNMMVVTLVGWRLAGFVGALVATLALIVPSAVLAGVTVTLWHRFRDKPWRRAVQAGLVPVTVGLIASGAIVIAVAVDTEWRLAAVTAIVAVLHFTTRLHPLWLLAGGAACGAIGLL